MMPHLRYLWYVLKHKWLVFVECVRLGIPWQGITHDWSKFLPDEWGPYVEYFYNRPKDEFWKANDEYGCLEAAPYGFLCEERFNIAWNHHQKRNPHHWQYWLLVEDEGDTVVFPMPDKFRREMLADWIGAGRALGHPDTQLWYINNRDKMCLHPETRAWIEEQLNVVIVNV